MAFHIVKRKRTDESSLHEAYNSSCIGLTLEIAGQYKVKVYLIRCYPRKIKGLQRIVTVIATYGKRKASFGQRKRGRGGKNQTSIGVLPPQIFGSNYSYPLRTTSNSLGSNLLLFLRFSSGLRAWRLSSTCSPQTSGCLRGMI